MKKAISLNALLFAFSIAHAEGAVLASGPDAWTRGELDTATEKTSYFGWDVFEASGIPGNPPFAPGQILNDSTPDVGSSALTVNLVQGDFSGYGHRSSSGNIYSGFTGGALDLDLSFNGLSAADTGSTTILLTVVGNPAIDRVLQNFTLNDGSSSIAPVSVLIGESTELSGQNLWIAEWQVTGSASTYTIDILSDLASGSGTDVSLDSITVDIAWNDTSTALANSSSLEALGSIQTIPEPSVGLLTLLSAGFLINKRRRA